MSNEEHQIKAVFDVVEHLLGELDETLDGMPIDVHISLAMSLLNRALVWAKDHGLPDIEGNKEKIIEAIRSMPQDGRGVQVVR